MPENKEICKKCGGKCCKKSGCDYSPQDFNDLSFNGLLNKLNEGNISIVSTLRMEKLPDGSKYINPFLYLRARNKNRDIIDLFSMKTICSQLTENGCRYSYEERPSYGRNLIPVENGLCYPSKDPNLILKEWDGYQKVLSKIVKRLTGETVEERLRQDVENTAYQILKGDFKDIDEKEILDIQSFILTLIEVYPKEFINAKNRLNSKNYIKV